jgi:DNA-binding phage protein
VSSVLNSPQKNPTLETLKKVAKALGVSVDNLIT